MRYASVVPLSFILLAGATSSSAYPQALPSRTWVSSSGNDSNACSRSAPCASFATALTKTAAYGEIDVLDAGSYGNVSINKSITIDGNGFVAGILTLGPAGVFVSAGDNDIVILRNLEINGGGAGFDGIFFANGKQLVVEHTRVFGFQSHAIIVDKPSGTAAQNLVISNSTISAAQILLGGGTGVRTTFGVTTVSHSVITGTNIGLLAEDTGVINADSNVLTGNNEAVRAGSGASGQSAATVRLSNNDIYGNRTGFGCGGGILATAGNNRKGSNVGGTVPACAPTVAITQQ